MKDTARNILDSREFSISLVEENQLDVMHQTSAPYAESEFDRVGLGRVAGVEIQATAALNPPRHQAFQDLLWALMNTKEFLFNH